MNKELLVFLLLGIVFPVIGDQFRVPEENLEHSVTNRESPPLSNLSPTLLSPSLQAQLRRELEQLHLPIDPTQQKVQEDKASSLTTSKATQTGQTSFTDLDPYF